MGQVSAKSLKNESITNNKGDICQIFYPEIIGASLETGYLNPEVTKKIIEQTPEVSLTSRTAVNGIQTVHGRNMNSNDESVNNCYKILEGNAETLRQLLLKDDISEKEREFYVQEIMQCAKDAMLKDTENKDFISKESNKTYKTILAGVGILTLSLGLSIVLRTPIKLK